MREPFHPEFLPTAVGSLPHKVPVVACRLIKKYLPQIPVWPQLPHRAFLEGLCEQYSEGFPGVTVDTDHERVWVDCTRDLTTELGEFYEQYIANNWKSSGLSPDYAAGLEHFRSIEFNSACAIKGQITGPVTWGLGIKDQDGRSILYDDYLADIVPKYLRLKAAWQEHELRKLTHRTIVCVDEPYLRSLGSAYVNIPNDRVIALLEEVFAGLKGLKAVHCCGNTEWPILLATSADILSFDAYKYAESLSLFPHEVRSFLKGGGIIAWGIVPVDEEAILMSESVPSLTEKLESAIKLVASKGVPLDDLFASALITPACGMTTLSEKGAEQALWLLTKVSERMRKKYLLPPLS